MNSRRAAALALLGHASACSLSRGKGYGISNIDQTSSEGTSKHALVRLLFDKFDDDGNTIAQEQAIFDTSTGSLEPHDNTMEWMPTMWGYDDHSAPGAFNLTTQSVTVTIWGSSATFVLPNASAAIWWYSVSLQRILFVYGGLSTFDLSTFDRVASCTLDGTCVHSMAPPGIGYLDTSRPQAMVWDEEGLVGLPLMCCVCISWEYHTFNLTADGALELMPVPPLNMMGVAWYDTAADEVWASRSAYTGYGDTLTVERYSYAHHQLETFEVPTVRVEQLFGGQAQGWVVAVIATASVLGVGLVVALGWLACKRRKQLPLSEAKHKAVSATVESKA